MTKCGQQTLLAGNICKSPLNFVKINSKNWKLEIPARQQLELQAIAGGENWKFIILELSSWQLESLGEHRLSPKLALITNILPDHLNRYQNFAAYVQAKKLIYKYQTNKDALFLNSADPRLRQIGASPSIKAKIVWYGASGKDGSLSLIHPNNLSAVKSVCRYLKIPARPMEKAIKSFPGLNGRLEHLGIINGITYINDTCATQPEATIYAIDKLSGKKIILIAGGEDKKLDFKKDKSGLYMLVDSNDVFHFPLKDYQKGFSLEYRRIEPTEDGIGRMVILSHGIDPYDPNLPEPQKSTLRSVLDDHLIEIDFEGRINPSIPPSLRSFKPRAIIFIISRFFLCDISNLLSFLKAYL